MILQTIIQQNPSVNQFNELIDTNGVSTEITPLTPFYTYQLVYNQVDGFWYLAFYGRAGVPDNRKSIIYKIDSSLTVVQSAEIPTQVSPNSDNHLFPTIDFSSDGNVWVSREKGKSGTTLTDGHNTPLLLYKTTINGDLSSLTQISEIAGQWSYDIIWLRQNDICVGARGDVSASPELPFILGQWFIHKSLDDGNTWTEYKVIDLDYGSNSNRAYVQKLKNLVNNDIVICLNRRNDTIGAFEDVAILKSSDGITWSNWQGTFTKNVSSSGAITNAELNTNFIVWNKKNDDYAVNFEGGVVKSDGIRFLASENLLSGDVQIGNAIQSYESLRVYTFNTSWTFQDLSDLAPNYEANWGLERLLQLTWDETADYIYIVDKTQTPSPLLELKSTNKFQNYTVETLTTLEGDVRYGAHSINSRVNSERLLGLYRQIGNDLDFTGETELLLFRFR